MDPVEVAWALSDMKLCSTRLGAIVHSHPTTPPIPSALDLAEATLPGVFSVIVGFAPPVVVRAWRLPFGEMAVGEIPIEAQLRIVAGVNS